MKSTKRLVPILALLLLLVMASETTADISNAAVLYLRIAPGARAAGMGEAYVAIADDATSTHWNPAGLGSYPLSPGWVEAKVPEDLRPVTASAALKTRGGGNYGAYDVWAVTPRGLARFDNKDWYLYEEFDTKTDQTVEGIVASYFGFTDAARIAEAVGKVAAANNRESQAYLDSLEATVMAAIPSEYSNLESLQSGFDSLQAVYRRCLINWDKVYEASKKFNEGMKDGSLTEKEVDRVNFDIENARNRFIPEQLLVPYSALIDTGSITGIVSAEEAFVVSTTEGAFSYDGRDWLILTLQNGLPSMNVTALAAGDDFILIATDKGVVKTDGYEVTPLGAAGGLPEAPISAVAFGGGEEAWAVVNNTLYHFDGQTWSNSYQYTVILDDTPDRIAEKHAIYGTDSERDQFITLMKELNAAPAESPDTTEADAETVTAPSNELVLEPGTEIKVPYVAGFKGEVTSLLAWMGGHVWDRHVWIGTSYGLIHRSEDGISLTGYDDQTYEIGDVIGESAVSCPLDSQAYVQAVTDINDLADRDLQAGQTIKLYDNPTAAPIHAIAARGDRVYFGTTLGLIVFDGTSFSMADFQNLSETEVIDVMSIDNEIWFSGEERIVCKANSKTDISMMYVKWLPELADDLYYAFASFASHKEGWGTFGGNFTYISYGTITRTGDSPDDIQGTFDSFDMALTGSWGTSLTKKLKAGLSAKVLYSKLADQGAGEEQGEGTSTGFAIDFGFLYHMTRRLDLGLAITNLGPDMAYIDAAQSDPLPRNLAFGFAYKVLQTDYYHFLATAEVNKSLVGVDDGFREELKQLVLNGGAEFLYANLLALRAGYIYDQEGDIKTVTLGVGLGPVGIIRFDFSYIPSNSDVALENTLRISAAIQP
ncbi:MAG: PorV/PorQ family protein [Candidatus Zixiibacteriota bacterium]|nr:MAG: PorV/PorQ family protein [candidate division Zixibacteria bacterium]